MDTITMSLARSKMIAFTAMIALIFSSFGYLAFFNTASAANMTSVSDTLSDSDLGVAADHEIVFTTPSGIAADENLSIEFAQEFQIGTSSVVAGDIAVNITGVGAQTVASTCGASDVAASTTGSVLNIYFCTATVAAGGTTTVQVGTNAGGSNQFVNPEQAGSYEILLGTSATGGTSTVSDGGATRIVIIDDVVVTATVATIFTFTINGLPIGTTVNGSPTTTATTTTATLLPFGELATGGQSKTLAQNLQVQTNARNGFTVTLEQDQNLLSSTGADIDSFANDGASSTPAAWEGPAGYLNDENTYGHMGITSDDATLVGGDTFGSDLWVGDFVGTPREVFYNDGPADGTTDNIGSTTVGFQAEIMAFQEAGDDYTATITYVATPVF